MNSFCNACRAALAPSPRHQPIRDYCQKCYDEMESEKSSSQRAVGVALPPSQAVTFSHLQTWQMCQDANNAAKSVTVNRGECRGCRRSLAVAHMSEDDEYCEDCWEDKRENKFFNPYDSDSESSG